MMYGQNHAAVAAAGGGALAFTGTNLVAEVLGAITVTLAGGALLALLRRGSTVRP